MKGKRFVIAVVSVLVVLQFCVSAVWAGPTTAYEAEKVVMGWLRADARPLGAELGHQVRVVESFTDTGGEVVYYIVYLEPSGFVIVPADDLVEPIVGFAERGRYEPSVDNPLGALVSRDLNGRVLAARDTLTLGASGAMATALRSQRKWDRLGDLGESGGPVMMGLGSISDVRVEPLVQSRWGQTTCCTDPCLACYNYYTPPYAPNDPCNYPCGCVATAMAQVMRYHEYPTLGIGVNPNTISVDGNPQTAFTRGGDGLGGPYNWDLMVYEPNCNTMPLERQAIGHICYDAGVASNMSYWPLSTGSRTTLPNAKNALVNTFTYPNAICVSTMGLSIGAGLTAMINPNLDYSHPVILGIFPGTSDGHAVVTDGYGYDFGTLYHHLNMGWEGVQDAWYNFSIPVMPPTFTVVDGCLYNLFVTGGDELISGRVTDAYGNTLTGETVTAERSGGGTYQAVTNSRGIYVLAHVPSGSTYTVSVIKEGYGFSEQVVNTGTSTDGAVVSGNVWGVDFAPFGTDTIYVDTTAAGNDDGTNWADAFNYLQDALAAASSGDTILVAEGVYKPDQGGGQTPGSRTATFQLISGVAIYGGFPTGGTNSWQDRDVTANETILSGDIGVPDVNTDNSYHVVTGSGTDGTAVLDGFTIIAGNASGASPDGGGGIFNNPGSPSINNCTVTQNYAWLGGAMCNRSSSYPTITNCRFTDNDGRYAAGIYNENMASVTGEDCVFSGNTGFYGGAINNSNSATNINLTGCTFTDNYAGIAGAGIYNEGTASFTECVFERNSSGQSSGVMYNAVAIWATNCVFIDNDGGTHYGGAVRNQGATGQYTNCVFVGNTVGSTGGAAWNYNSNINYVNCTFGSNKAVNYGGGMYNHSLSAGNADPCVINCIFWGNEDSGGVNEPAQIYNGQYSTAYVSYTCIQDDDPNDGYIPYGGAANGNIDDNPLFSREPDDGGDGWGNANDDYGNLRLGPGSPCIDTGDNSGVAADVADIDGDGDSSEPIPFDIDRHFRFSDGDCNGTTIVDMGAYEFAYLYIGDLDGDCDVDFDDFAIFSANWLAGVK